jgi:hypothetical protein
MQAFLYFNLLLLSVKLDSLSSISFLINTLSGLSIFLALDSSYAAEKNDNLKKGDLTDI